MLKILKPSMREKKRYLMLSGNFTKKEVESAIKEYIGVLGYAKASPMWISSNVLAVNRKELNNVRASFVLTKNISVLKVSGTLKGLKG
jgi:RNase P/RNase MRP subunit POP5